MFKIVVPIEGVNDDSLSQLEYALTFVSQKIVSYVVDSSEKKIILELVSEDDKEPICEKINELIRRYKGTQFGTASTTYFKQEHEVPIIDAWRGLLERKWITPVGEGHVILRGPAASLMGLIDSKIDDLLSEQKEVEREYYPSTILCESLDKAKHFTSFPEHVDFVAHIKPDLEVISGFAKDCKERGWSPEFHVNRMSLNDFAISPSCCYHCYEGMEGWRIEKPGRTITATINCHRYEGGNHRSLSRLRSFTMREIIWVGDPKFVMENRARTEKSIIQWAKDWEFDCTFQIANDMFFTDDFTVKASFQRRQQAKKELRIMIPFEGQDISVFSSNYHARTFGKAFNISVNERTATSGCVGWGFERWIYAIFSQFGFDFEKWPNQLREDFNKYNSSGF